MTPRELDKDRKRILKNVLRWAARTGASYQETSDRYFKQINRAQTDRLAKLKTDSELRSSWPQFPFQDDWLLVDDHRGKRTAGAHGTELSAAHRRSQLPTRRRVVNAHLMFPEGLTDPELEIITEATTDDERKRRENGFEAGWFRRKDVVRRGAGVWVLTDEALALLEIASEAA